MQREAHQNTLGKSRSKKDGIQMTRYKAGASKPTAPSGGPGSFPTPVRGRGRMCRGFFQSRDEEAVCMEENNKGMRSGEEGEQQRQSSPCSLGTR